MLSGVQSADGGRNVPAGIGDPEDVGEAVALEGGLDALGRLGRVAVDDLRDREGLRGGARDDEAVEVQPQLQVGGPR